MTRKKVRKVVNVSTHYTGTRKMLGEWVKPKRMVVYISRGSNTDVYKQLRKKKSLKHKQFSWWDARRN